MRAMAAVRAIPTIKATHVFGMFLAKSSSPLAKSKGRRSSRCRLPRSCPVTPPASGGAATISGIDCTSLTEGVNVVAVAGAL